MSYCMKQKIAWSDVLSYEAGGVEGAWGFLMTSHKTQDNNFGSKGIVCKALTN